MRLRSRLLAVAVLALALLVPATAQAGDVITIRTVKSWDAQQPAPAHVYSEPAISGDWVVYSDAEGLANTNVRALNIRTGQDFALRAQSKAQYAPAIYGTKVVWTDRKNDDFNVYLCDLTSPSVITTVAGGPSNPGQLPAIYGNYVVYEDNSPTRNVKIYNITSRTTSTIGSGRNARIHGDWVVYQTETSPAQIHAFRVSTGQDIAITNASGSQLKPDIWADKVVWEGATTNGVFIFWKSVLSMGSPTGISLGTNNHDASVSNNRIFFKSNEGGTTRLWMHDLGSGVMMTPMQLSADDMTGEDQNEPARPCGDTIVYRQDNDVLWGRIYAPTLSMNALPTVVNYNAPVTLTGSITDFGVPLGNILSAADSLQWESSGDGGMSWVASTEGLATNANGAFSRTVPGVKTKTWYRVKYVGAYNPFTWNVHLSALGGARAVTPRVALGAPTVPTTLYRGKSFTAYNYIVPLQVNGSKPVKVECYRLESGTYRLRATVWASASYYTTAKSKYAATIALPYSGKWRMRAVYPTSATHYWTASGWVYRTIP